MERSFTKFIQEPAKQIKVLDEVDVIVVGGGPAGVAASVASARNGANTVLIERYGYLGGLSTGGLVILIMPMSDESGKQCIAGLSQEIIDRLDSAGACIHPRADELGSADPKVVEHWVSRGTRFFAQENRVTLNALFDPEGMKCVLNDMVEESKTKLILHSYVSCCLIDNSKVYGIIFESKSGRLAVLSKIIIDTTGDGDMFASAGAKFDSSTNPHLRSSKLALVFRVGNVDFEKFNTFRTAENLRYRELIAEVQSLGGFGMCIPSWREDVVWFNNFLPGLNGLSIEDLTWVEINVRKKSLITIDFFKRNIPGFQNSFIIDTASQVGVRATRRLTGEYVVRENDLQSGILHDDTIAVIPARQWAPSIKPSLVSVPYRSLLPVKIDNLITAGRCFSSDQVANDILAPIQVCIAQGQAAGTAAALAVQSGLSPKQIDIRLLQSQLKKQGVPLDF